MKPIIFNSRFIDAILAGQKTQTRRAIKPQPYWSKYLGMHDDSIRHCGSYRTNIKGHGIRLSFPMIKCPYGVVGDKLWVQETFMDGHEFTANYPKDNKHVWYKSNGDAAFSRWKPPTSMPRWASRITLEITNVRVERVQDISYEDTQKEGLGGVVDTTLGIKMYQVCEPSAWFPQGISTSSPFEAFERRWDSMHGDGEYSCRVNPWVWVIEFKLLEGGKAQ